MSQGKPGRGAVRNMYLRLVEINNQDIAELVSDEVEINNVQDALDIMAGANNDGAGSIIIHEKNLSPQFFDLRTGLAGEVMQKFINYNVRLAIVGDFARFNSDSLKALMLECNRGSQICFMPDVDSAMEKMAGATRDS